MATQVTELVGGWRQFETDSDYAVVIQREGEEPETWESPVIQYPPQPTDTYLVPIIDFDGKGPIAWPLGGE